MSKDWRDRAYALEKTLPERLVELSMRAGKASQGFFILNDLEGYSAFEYGLVNKLQQKGWPIFKRDKDGSWLRAHAPSDAWIIEGLNEIPDFISGYTPTSKSAMRENLAYCLIARDDTEEIRDFLVQNENLDTFESAINEITGELQQKYGDPFAIKYKQNSVLRAVFAAVADKVSGKQTPDLALYDKLKTYISRATEYVRDLKIPSREYQGRINVELINMGWPMKMYCGQNDSLASVLWELTSEAEVSSLLHKTSIPLRYSLQDETTPPRKSIGEAKQFVRDYVDEFLQAQQTINTEIDEALKNNTFVMRHIGIAGMPGDGRLIPVEHGALKL